MEKTKRLRIIESFWAVELQPHHTDVQHTPESAPGVWTAIGRAATLQWASVDVRNETAKDRYAGGDGVREHPSTHG